MTYLSKAALGAWLRPARHHLDRPGTGTMPGPDKEPECQSQSPSEFRFGSLSLGDAVKRPRRGLSIGFGFGFYVRHGDCLWNIWLNKVIIACFTSTHSRHPVPPFSHEPLTSVWVPDAKSLSYAKRVGNCYLGSRDQVRSTLMPRCFEISARLMSFNLHLAVFKLATAAKVRKTEDKEGRKERRGSARLGHWKAGPIWYYGEACKIWHLFIFECRLALPDSVSP